jgi:hypothetical protein
MILCQVVRVQLQQTQPSTNSFINKYYDYIEFAIFALVNMHTISVLGWNSFQTARDKYGSLACTFCVALQTIHPSPDLAPLDFEWSVPLKQQ